MKVFARHNSKTGQIVVPLEPFDVRRFWPGHIRCRGKRYEECYYIGDRIMWYDVTDEVVAAFALPQERPAP